QPVGGASAATGRVCTKKRSRLKPLLQIRWAPLAFVGAALAAMLSLRAASAPRMGASRPQARLAARRWIGGARSTLRGSRRVRSGAGRRGGGAVEPDQP